MVPTGACFDKSCSNNKRLFNQKAIRDGKYSIYFIRDYFGAGGNSIQYTEAANSNNCGFDILRFWEISASNV